MDKAAKFLIPGSQFVWYVLLALTGLLWGNASLIAGKLPEASQIAGSTVALVLDQLSRSNWFNTLVTVLFWDGLITVALVLVWALINMGIEARNEFVQEFAYVNKGSLYNRIKAPLLQVGLAALLAAAILVSALVVVPFLIAQFGLYLAQSPQALAFAGLALVVLVASAIIHVLVVLGRLVFLAA